MLSMANDDMIRLCMMYPETFFFDVTGGTNNMSHNVFIMCTKDSSGKCFATNVTVIPSERSWVFMTIFKFAFEHLYGEITIERNRLGLTDKDIAKYGALLNCINTCPMWKNSKLMLCVFHAVWKPFNEMIKPRLPKNGKMFTTVGKLYGKNIVCIYIAL